MDLPKALAQALDPLYRVEGSLEGELRDLEDTLRDLQDKIRDLERLVSQ
jgi:predicted  nucleic acid-binding Zn-ribbon protein